MRDTLREIDWAIAALSFLIAGAVIFMGVVVLAMVVTAVGAILTSPVATAGMFGVFGGMALAICTIYVYKTLED